MADVTVTGANETPAAPTTADALTPPVNDGFNHIDPSVESVSDIDGFTPPAKEGETKDAKAEADAKAAEEKAESERFDKHPRFQELIKERDTFKQELAEIKGQLKTLTPQDKAIVEKREDKGLPYIDITTKSKEELLEWQEDDPKGYAANLYQQIYHETQATLKAEQAEEARKATEAKQSQSIKETFEKYEKDNPDFRNLWDSGELKKVMDENPGIGAIGAHMKLNQEAVVKAAVDKAVKEAEDRVTKNFQAKKNAQVIGDGGPIRESNGIPDELAHPDKYGGRTQALAGRLERLRQAAQGG